MLKIYKEKKILKSEVAWYNFTGLKLTIELELLVLERRSVEDPFEGDWNKIKNWNV